MSKLNFGPMTEFDVNDLKVILDEAGAKYSVHNSNDDLESIYQSRYPQGYIHGRRTYDGNDTFLYIEIEERDLDLIRTELENRALIDDSSK